MKIFFLHFFQSTHQEGMKNAVKCYKDFFGYFNALKTHSEKGIQCTKSKFYFPNICCALHNAWALAFGAAEIEFKEIHEMH